MNDALHKDLTWEIAIPVLAVLVLALAMFALYRSGKLSALLCCNCLLQAYNRRTLDGGSSPFEAPGVRVDLEDPRQGHTARQPGQHYAKATAATAAAAAAEQDFWAQVVQADRRLQNMTEVKNSPTPKTPLRALPGSAIGPEGDDEEKAADPNDVLAGRITRLMNNFADALGHQATNHLAGYQSLSTVVEEYIAELRQAATKELPEGRTDRKAGLEERFKLFREVLAEATTPLLHTSLLQGANGGGGPVSIGMLSKLVAQACNGNMNVEQVVATFENRILNPVARHIHRDDLVMGRDSGSFTTGGGGSTASRPWS